MRNILTIHIAIWWWVHGSNLQVTGAQRVTQIWWRVSWNVSCMFLGASSAAQLIC